MDTTNNQQPNEIQKEVQKFFAGEPKALELITAINNARQKNPLMYNIIKTQLLTNYR